MFKGVTLGYYAPNGYFSSQEARTEIDRIAELGIPWICLVCTVMQDAYYSTRMYRDFKNTPGDDELIEIIGYIHAKNIKVMFRPMLEATTGPSVQTSFCLRERSSREWHLPTGISGLRITLI